VVGGGRPGGDGGRRKVDDGGSSDREEKGREKEINENTLHFPLKSQLCH